MLIGSSVRGSSHTKNNTVNQDSFNFKKKNGYMFLAVSDGHGGIKYSRSHLGSKFATEVAVDILEDFVCHTENNISYIKRCVEEELPKLIYKAWNKKVKAHISENPLTCEELLNFKPDENHEIAYGATLISAVVGPEYTFFLQIGDGDILILDGENVYEEIIKDSRHFANETTSLCMKNAFSDFETSFKFRKPPELIMISTDGYANSFKNQEGFHKAIFDISIILKEKGAEYTENNLSDWLNQTSIKGSGDDITVVLCAFGWK